MNEHEQAFEKYMRSVQLLMLDFQFIEELLKIVIGCSYEALRRSAPFLVRFRPTRGDLEKNPLGRLIDKYGDVSRNDTLVKQLRAVVQDRNFCAHQSLVLHFEKQQDVLYLQNECLRLEAIRQKTKPCVEALHAEFEKFVSFLQEPPNTTIERDAPQAARPSL